MRLIDTDAIPWEEHYVPDLESGKQWEYKKELCVLKPVIDQIPTVNAIELPCKIGDTAWAIRNHTGHLHPHRGIVSDMYFVKGMKLCVVVHGIARGEWGKTIFGTYEEAERAIEERKP